MSFFIVVLARLEKLPERLYTFKLLPSLEPKLKTQVLICSCDLLLPLALNAQCTVNSILQRKSKGKRKEMRPEACVQGLLGPPPNGELGRASTEGPG